MKAGSLSASIPRRGKGSCCLSRWMAANTQAPSRVINGRLSLQLVAMSVATRVQMNRPLSRPPQWATKTISSQPRCLWSSQPFNARTCTLRRTPLWARGGRCHPSPSLLLRTGAVADQSWRCSSSTPWRARTAPPQVALLLQRFHQLRQQGMEPLAAHPITGFPERHQRLNHLGALATPVLASLAALPLICPLVQPEQQRFAVIAGQRLQFIQQPLLPREAQALVTRCCRVDCQRNPLPFLERARSAWPQAFHAIPHRCHGRLLLLMQQPEIVSSFTNAMRRSTCLIS